MVGDWGSSAGRRDNADEQWGRTAPWADRRTATGPQAMPTRPAGRPPAGPEDAAPWETESWGTAPQALPSGTGPQRSPRWQTGPQAPLSGTGPRPAMTPQDAGQPSAPAGWSRDTGEWERAARAERAERADRADRAEESARLGESGYSLEDDFPVGPTGGSGPWPAASAVPGTPSAAGRAGAGKPERHSHRASKHGRPSRWRGSSDRPGRDGES
jgi:hypothetical protein